jgi:hypothetical protein
VYLTWGTIGHCEGYSDSSREGKNYFSLVIYNHLTPIQLAYEVELADGCVMEIDQQSPRCVCLYLQNSSLIPFYHIRLRDNSVILNWLISQKQVQIDQEQWMASGKISYKTT